MDSAIIRAIEITREVMVETVHLAGVALFVGSILAFAAVWSGS